MNEEILVWLHDIKESIIEIEDFYRQTGKSFHTYNTNAMLRKAVERNFILVGEAVRRILDKEPAFPITDGKKIIGFRNRLAHEYDKLDNEIIYNITLIHLPRLLQEVTDLLDKNRIA